MNKIKEALVSYGLSQKEVDIYLFLLSNKDVPAYEIAKQTRIPRTTVYNLLESLESQKIISSWTKNNVKHFSAETPNRLKQIIKTKEEILLSIFPDILDMYEFDSMYPTSKLYQGKEGVKHVFENILGIIKKKKLKRLYVFSDYLLTEQLPKFFAEWRKRKNETEAHTYLIVPHGTPVNENYTSNDHRETRVMPESFPFEGSVDICGSHVAFFSFKKEEMYAITIDSPIIAGMLTKFFMYMWQTLEGKTLTK